MEETGLALQVTSLSYNCPGSAVLESRGAFRVSGWVQIAPLSVDPVVRPRLSLLNGRAHRRDAEREVVGAHLCISNSNVP
jgi:hypothetical protein